MKSAWDKMEQDIQKYDDLANLEERADSTREYLIEMKERLYQRGAFMETEAKQLSLRYEKNKDLLERSETWQSLKEFEDKLCRQGQVVHTLKEFVSRKGRQTNYETIKSDCVSIVEELNDLLLSSQ